MEINENMKFTCFKDFFDKCDYIKGTYNGFSCSQKQLYKRYVYSNTKIYKTKLDKIWEYLNEPFGSVYYLSKEMLEIYL